MKYVNSSLPCEEPVRVRLCITTHYRENRVTKPLILLSATVLLISGCATHSRYPSALSGSYTALSARNASLADYRSYQVRWGGRIVRIELGDNRTCFEMIEARLDTYGRPDWRDESGGRYIACRTGFYDPSVFRINRDLTITGTLASYEVRRISGHDYRFPLLEADVVYLWPERVPPKRNNWPYWYW